MNPMQLLDMCIILKNDPPTEMADSTLKIWYFVPGNNKLQGMLLPSRHNCHHNTTHICMPSSKSTPSKNQSSFSTNGMVVGGHSASTFSNAMMTNWAPDRILKNVHSPFCGEIHSVKAPAVATFPHRVLNLGYGT